MKINLISVDNKGGLTQDVKIIKTALEGHEFKFHDIHNPGRVEQADINIHIEHLDPRFFKYAVKNFLIPNPEWFAHAWLKDLPKVTEVWCKTADAMKIFASLGCKTQFISFSSFDRTDPKIKRQPVCLHLSGYSDTKGTPEVIQCWERHPDLPTLILAKRKKVYLKSELHNLKLIDWELTPTEVTKLINYAQFHICPSLYEGFGHYINEGKSVGAIVITTDAPPMNELIDPTTGFLVRVQKYSRQNMGRLNYIDPDDLYEKVMTAFEMDKKSLQAISDNAVRSYLTNHQFFRKTIREAVYD